MKYHTGLFDKLFGKKVTLRVPQDDGSTKELSVTEAWLSKMEAEGKVGIEDLSSKKIPFHVIGPDGSETRQLTVGEDIPHAQYEKLADPETGDLYGIMVYENGSPRTNVVSKPMWGQVKSQFDSIDAAGEASRRSLREQLGDL